MQKEGAVTLEMLDFVLHTRRFILHILFEDGLVFEQVDFGLEIDQFLAADTVSMFEIEPFLLEDTVSIFEGRKLFLEGCGSV